MVCCHVFAVSRDFVNYFKMEYRTLFMFISLLIKGSLAVESLKFLALGDWGGLPVLPYSTPIETSCAKSMSKITDYYGTEFNLALGDNFYFKGVTDVDDKRFFETFERVFHYKQLMNPWYFIAGNHDHNGNVSAEIAYSKVSKRWNYPDYYYSLSKFTPDGKSRVDILMLDTVLLCGNTGDDILGDQPKGAEDKSRAEDQWQWLEKQLAVSRADYLLVTGHFPVYSIAEHGPTKCLVDRLDALLYKYNVTAYMCGHDHNLQHLQTSTGDQTMNYFVTGAANFVEDNQNHKDDVPKNSLKFFNAELPELGGFLYIEATSTNMTFSFIDGEGKHLYRQVVPPRKLSRGGYGKQNKHDFFSIH